MRKKLSSRRGETLVEALCSVLIAALAAALLATMVSSASRLNIKARENDAQLYSSISAAETYSGITEEDRNVIVTIGEENTDVTVDVYGDVVSSYKKSEG